MKEKSIATTMALFILMVFCVPSLWAAEIDVATAFKNGLPACAQQYIGTVDSRVIRIAGVDKDGNACWGSCKLSVDKDGNISKGTYVDCSGIKAQVVGGKLSISENCEIQGTIVTKLETLQIDRGAVVGNEVVLGLADSNSNASAQGEPEE
jgi:hypothetical protein